ncbi:ankyrin repeat domain-containing protein [Phreatobacter sp. HK31-P]
MDVSPELSELFCTMMRAGRQEVAQAILSEPDCDVQHRTNGGQTPLHIAAMAFMPGIVALLIAKGADPNVLDDRGRTPLMIAAKAGDDRAVEQLLKRGADPNLVTHQMRWTALMWAARYKRTAVLKRLLAAGADPKIQDKNGDTAIDLARKHGPAAALALLEPTIA